MACSNTKIQLKLMYDKLTRKVLYAEAGKDFVDILFTLLTLPIVAGAKLISNSGVERLFHSVVRMDAGYMQPGADKSDLLQPTVPKLASRNLLQQLLARFSLYTCPGRCVTMTMEASAECPQCKQPMAEEMAYVLPKDGASKAGDVGAEAASASSDKSGGYVVKGVLYMVTDELEVKPWSAGDAATIIYSFLEGGDASLAEKYVSVGTQETDETVLSCWEHLPSTCYSVLGQVVALVKAALRSDCYSVLSDVFLAKESK